eukprot:scaffold11064_cov63-Phaeocystis_antarctica.AAC.1
MEDEHDRRDVDDRGHGLDERHDDELHAGVALQQAQRPEHAQDAQHLELREEGHELGEVDEQRVDDDAEVEHVPRLLEVRPRAVGDEARGDDLDRELAREAQGEDRVEVRQQGCGGRRLVEQRRVDGEADLQGGGTALDGMGGVGTR